MSCLSLKKGADLFTPLLLCYFLALHADQLSFIFADLTVRISNFFALLLLGFMLLRGAYLDAFPRRLKWALALLSLSLLASCLVSEGRERSLLFFGWYGLTLVGYFLLPYLLLFCFPERRVMKLYLLSFVLVGVYGLLQFALSLIGVHDPFASQTFGAGWSRPSSFAYEPSYLALYMTPFVVLACGFFLLKRGGDFILFRRMGLKELLLCLLLYLSSFTTTTFFALVFFIALSFCLPTTRLFSSAYRARLRFSVAFALSCLALALGLPGFSRDIFFKFFSSEFWTHHSFYERWIGIENSFQLFLERPLFGVGLGNIPVHLFNAWREQDSRFFFLFNEDEFANAANPIKFFEPMNVATEILASAGLIGFLAFGFLLYSYYRESREALALPLPEERRIWIYLLLLSTFVMLIVLQFNQGLFRTYIWTHLAIAYAFTVRSKTTIEKSGPAPANANNYPHL